MPQNNDKKEGLSIPDQMSFGQNEDGVGFGYSPAVSQKYGADLVDGPREVQVGDMLGEKLVFAK